MTDETLPQAPDLPPGTPWDALLRHFADLRDGTHGGATTRRGKVAAFRRAVELLDPVAEQALTELDHALLLDTGTVARRGLADSAHHDARSGAHSDAHSDVAVWALSWAEQRQVGIAPIQIVAHFEPGFHHPHLRGGTVGDWPLNVSTTAQAEELAPTLRAIAAADLHNLVFAADYRIVPATMAGRS